MRGSLVSCPPTSLAPYKRASSIRGTSKMGLLWTPLSLLLLLLGKPACMRTQDHPSCPGRGLGCPFQQHTLIPCLGVLLPPRLTSLKEQGGSLIIWALHINGCK